MCRQGASVIQSAVLGAVNDPSLRVYVAWVPILPSDGGPPNEGTLALVGDKRAAHYWDAERALPGPYSRVLGLPADWPAWDVYMVYPPGATWGREPPSPAFWQHQLGELDAAPRLDGRAFAEGLRRLVGSRRPRGG